MNRDFKEIGRLKKQERINYLLCQYLLKHGLYSIEHCYIETVSLTGVSLVTVDFYSTPDFFQQILVHKSGFRKYLADFLKTKYVPKIYFKNNYKHG